jgi:hypothetical protein
MALFHDGLIQTIEGALRQRYEELGIALGEATGEQPREPHHLNRQSPLYSDVRLLIEVANGEHLRTSAPKDLVQRVESALQRVLDLLLGSSWKTPITIPHDFWRGETGVLISRVRWWLSADELITISNAAALAFGENTQANRMRITRAIENGLLTWVPDPSVMNPQQNKRVLRPQVEHLRDQRSLPE